MDNVVPSESAEQVPAERSAEPQVLTPASILPAFAFNAPQTLCDPTALLANRALSPINGPHAVSHPSILQIVLEPGTLAVRGTASIGLHVPLRRHRVV